MITEVSNDLNCFVVNMNYYLCAHEETAGLYIMQNNKIMCTNKLRPQIKDHKWNPFEHGKENTNKLQYAYMYI